jgi:hypothetical protein
MLRAYHRLPWPTVEDDDPMKVIRHEDEGVERRKREVLGYSTPRRPNHIADSCLFEQKMPFVGANSHEVGTGG